VGLGHWTRGVPGAVLKLYARCERRPTLAPVRYTSRTLRRIKFFYALSASTGFLVAAAFAAGCSTANVGPDDASSPTQKDASDADFGPAHPSKDGGADATRGCYGVSGTGATQQCTFGTNAAKGACPSGTASGACPSADLYGCCIAYTTDAGPSSFTATCYYSDAGAGGQALSACEDMSYESAGGYAWDPKLP
jgi:hypothetical protein